MVFANLNCINKLRAFTGLASSLKLGGPPCESHKGFMMMSFDEDAYMDRLVEQHMTGNDDEFSDCCGADILRGGICSECMEHCQSISDQKENAMWEAADAKRDLERDEQ